MAQASTRSGPFAFGPFLLDPAARELTRDGMPVELPARAFDCLTYLLVHRERAVGRDELAQAVFGRSNVSDAQIGQIVLRARRAVGDDGHVQNTIRTVPRFGFRWVAPTRAIAASIEPVRPEAHRRKQARCMQRETPALGLRMQAQARSQASCDAARIPCSPHPSVPDADSIPVMRRWAFKNKAPLACASRASFLNRWWRRRESNPRPQALYRQFYILSTIN